MSPEEESDDKLDLEGRSEKLLDVCFVFLRGYFFSCCVGEEIKEEEEEGKEREVKGEEEEARSRERDARD